MRQLDKSRRYIAFFVRNDILSVVREARHLAGLSG